MSNQNSYTIRATLESAPRTYLFEVVQDSVVLEEGYDFAWDFGDGNTSFDPFPVHTYTGPGNYTVTVQVKLTDPKNENDKTGNSDPPEPPIIPPHALMAS